jgi:hypothetical protein
MKPKKLNLIIILLIIIQCSLFAQEPVALADEPGPGVTSILTMPTRSCTARILA